MLSAARNGLAAVLAKSSGNSCSIVAITLRRSGAAVCSRCRVVIRPKRS